MSGQTSTHAIDEQANKAHVKRIWKAFWILAILTAIELGLGLTIYFLEKGDPSYTLIITIKGVITILTVLKAFYIIIISWTIQRSNSLRQKLLEKGYIPVKALQLRYSEKKALYMAVKHC